MVDDTTPAASGSRAACGELLAGDPNPDAEFKERIRQSAAAKVARLEDR